MKHAVATAVVYGQIQSYGEGFVWCVCGKRFGLYHEDEMMRHIKDGNDDQA